jgi:hypothetical protein
MLEKEPGVKFQRYRSRNPSGDGTLLIDILLSRVMTADHQARPARWRQHIEVTELLFDTVPRLKRVLPRWRR